MTVDDEFTFYAKSIIVAPGASAKWLNIPSEEKLEGKGVSACATCDGAFFRKEHVVVVGGGDTAMEEATFLTKFADKVTVLHRRDELRASKAMQQRAFNNDKIEFLWNSELDEILGDIVVQGVRVRDRKSTRLNPVTWPSRMPSSA